MEQNKYINSFATEEKYEAYTRSEIMDIPNVALIDAIGEIKYTNKFQDLLLGTIMSNGDFMIGMSTSGATTKDCINVHTVHQSDGLNYIYARQEDILKTPVSLFEAFKEKDITKIARWKIDTSSVTNMGSMFSGCNSLRSAYLSGLNTSSVTNMVSMFFNCKRLEKLDLSGFKTFNVTNMGSMFGECESLTSLNLPNFDTTNVTNMWSMFAQCNSLTSLNLPNFDTTNVTTMINMFGGCSKLNKLYLTSSFFNSTKVKEYDFSPLTTWTDIKSLAQFVNAITAHDGSGKTVKLSANTKNALTQTQKDAITAKGWTIS